MMSARTRGWRVAWAAALAVPFAASLPAAQAALTDDHVYDLAQTWACRTQDGAIRRRTGRRTGDAVTRHVDSLGGASPASYDERYSFDNAAGRWLVSSAPATVAAFSGSAPAWTGTTWTVDGTDVNGVPRRLTFERLPGGDYRLTTASPNGPGWYPDGAERCSPGATPPGPGSCIVANYPAATLVGGDVPSRYIPRNLRHGTVMVVISLDEQSRIVNARVLSSPSPALNAPALAAARASTFRTEIRDCKPVAADFIFGVGFDE